MSRTPRKPLIPACRPIAWQKTPEVMTPVMVCLDGFTLSHTEELVDLPTQEEVDRFLPPYAPQHAIDLSDPRTFSIGASPDFYMEYKYSQQLGNGSRPQKDPARWRGSLKTAFGREHGGVRQGVSLRRRRIHPGDHGFGDRHRQVCSREPARPGKESRGFEGSLFQTVSERRDCRIPEQRPGVSACSTGIALSETRGRWGRRSSPPCSKPGAGSRCSILWPAWAAGIFLRVISKRCSR